MRQVTKLWSKLYSMSIFPSKRGKRLLVLTMIMHCSGRSFGSSVTFSYNPWTFEANLGFTVGIDVMIPKWSDFDNELLGNLLKDKKEASTKSKFIIKCSCDQPTCMFRGRYQVCLPCFFSNNNTNKTLCIALSS